MKDSENYTIRRIELLAEELRKVRIEKAKNFWRTLSPEYVEREIEIIGKIIELRSKL